MYASIVIYKNVVVP